MDKNNRHTFHNRGPHLISTHPTPPHSPQVAFKFKITKDGTLARLGRGAMLLRGSRPRGVPRGPRGRSMHVVLHCWDPGPTLCNQTRPTPKTLLLKKGGVRDQLHVFPRAPQEVLPKLKLRSSSWSCGVFTHHCHSLHLPIRENKNHASSPSPSSSSSPFVGLRCAAASARFDLRRIV
jgi:hypothetical protein